MRSAQQAALRSDPFVVLPAQVALAGACEIDALCEVANTLLALFSLRSVRVNAKAVL